VLQLPTPLDYLLCLAHLMINNPNISLAETEWPYASRQAGGERVCVRACRGGNGKGFSVHQLREFTSILMVHYPVSAQAF
jgi:hypothetical protein